MWRRRQSARRGKGFDSRSAPRVKPNQHSNSRSHIARFGLTFLLLVTIFALFTSNNPAQRLVHSPLSILLVSVSSPFLSPFGQVHASGNHLSLNGFGVSVVEGCDGVLPTCIYIAAVIAFPSRWRDKAWGILIGIPTIFLINLVRVITLVICGAYWPAVFERVHIYVWQALVIGLSMAVWVFWAERFVRRGSEVGS